MVPVIKPPDKLPDSFWEFAGYVIVISSSIIVSRLTIRQPPQRKQLESSDSQSDRNEIIKSFLEEKIVELRDELNDRIDSLEDELTIHREYVEHLATIDGFTDPPFPSLERFMKERSTS